MKLDKISIANFKGLRTAEFDPTSFSCLVGENNAGKSTILQAVSIALNRPNQLMLDVFYDPTIPVEFTLQLSEISPADLLRLVEDHRARIVEIVNDGCLTLLVRYRPSDKVEVVTFRPVPIEQKYHAASIADNLKGLRGAAVREAVIVNYPEFGADCPEDLNITTAKGFLTEKILALPDEQFVIAEAPLPSGISSSISNLLPEPIYIPAVRNLSDEMKTSQSTSFGRLIGLLLEDLAPDLNDIDESFRQLNRLLNRVTEDGDYVDARHEKVRDMEVLVQGFLQEHFSNANVELNIPPPELKAILSTAQIYVDDGSRDLIENKGDGIKRSLTFALLRAYVDQLEERRNAGDQEDAPAPRPIIFLFEEPELYLHPRSQRILFDALGRISDAYQVVVTTHSPIFFAPGVTASFVRVEKVNAEPKPVGVLYPVNFGLDAASAETFKMARFENSDAAFFSRRVVLFEGESDDAFCKHVAKVMNPDWDFDEKNIALVRVSGKGNFSRFRRFFDSFGIDVKIVADLDAYFDGYQHLGVNAEVNQVRNDAIQLIDARILAADIKAEPATRQIRDHIQRNTWRARYDAAKGAVRSVQNDGVVTDDILTALDGLFTWESDIARVKACREDQTARQALVPALDVIREHGVCVLSKGAIEDYYPAEAPTTGSKPGRAISACALVTNLESARALSTPLGDGRVSELQEIFAELFREN